MRRLLLISLATIPLTGCQFFNSDTPVVDVIESVESGEALEAIPNSISALGDKEAEADAEAFEDPTVEGKGATGTVKADLIPSTSADARRKAIARSRVDPFAVLPIPPTPDPIVVSPNAVAAARNGAGSGGGGAAGASNNGGGGGGSRSRGGGSAAVNARPTATPVAARPTPTPPPVRVQPPNQPLVLPTPIAALPSIPQPVIAPTISVSGVIQLGNEPYAIVRSGSEPERYVKVGDRLAGGSVRVKRIETLAFEPQVILEENGIEVARPITAGGDGEAVEDTPVAAVPNVAIPAAAIPSAQPAVSALPSIPLISAPAALPMPTSSLQPAPGSVPSSLLLQPAEVNSQAVIPGFRVAVPQSV